MGATRRLWGRDSRLRGNDGREGRGPGGGRRATLLLGRVVAAVAARRLARLARSVRRGVAAALPAFAAFRHRGLDVRHNASSSPRVSRINSTLRGALPAVNPNARNRCAPSASPDAPPFPPLCPSSPPTRESRHRAGRKPRLSGRTYRPSGRLIRADAEDHRIRGNSHPRVELHFRARLLAVLRDDVADAPPALA